MSDNRTIRLLTPVSYPGINSSDDGKTANKKTNGGQSSLGLLDNTKPPVGVIMAALGQQVEKAHPSIQVKQFKKANTCVPASVEILDSFENECTFVINGIGD